MNKTLFNTTIRIIEILKGFLPVLAAIYIITWVIGLFNEGLFGFLDKFFGFFPNLFNSTFNVTYDIMGQDVPMGYAYMSLITIVICGIVYKIGKEIESKHRDLDFAIENTKKTKRQPEPLTWRRAQAKPAANTQKTEVKPQKEETDADISSFYGLLTFELKYINDEIIDEQTQKTLKYNYTKIIVEKLKEKYGSVNYAVSDKVFFICNNVSLFNLFVRDIVKLNKIISKISENQKIKTALKVSFWSSPKANPKEACSILLRINNLNYLNKIIVSKYIQLKFDKQLIKCFNFCPLGTVKLAKTNPQDKNEDIELFYLKTLE